MEPALYSILMDDLKKTVTKAHERFDYYDTLYKKDPAQYDKLGAGYVSYKVGFYNAELQTAGRLLTEMITGATLDSD